MIRGFSFFSSTVFLNFKNKYCGDICKHKINCFKVNSSVAFSIFTVLCNYVLYLVNKCLSFQSKPLCIFMFPLSLQLGQPPTCVMFL